MRRPPIACSPTPFRSPLLACIGNRSRLAGSVGALRRPRLRLGPLRLSVLTSSILQGYCPSAVTLCKLPPAPASPPVWPGHLLLPAAGFVGSLPHDSPLACGNLGGEFSGAMSLPLPGSHRTPECAAASPAPAPAAHGLSYRASVSPSGYRAGPACTASCLLSVLSSVGCARNAVVFRCVTPSACMPVCPEYDLDLGLLSSDPLVSWW